MNSTVQNAQTVLVTGAAGLIGQAVMTELLRRGYRVRAMTHRAQSMPQHPMLTTFTGSITDPTFVTQAVAGASYVVHLAARKSDERDSMDVNECGAKVLAEAVKAAGVRRLVNISTQSVKLPVHGLYARSKAAADRILEASGIPMTTLRLSVVYADAESGILGSLVGFSKLPIVPVIGDGKVSFQPIHRDDAARAIAELMTNPDAEGKIYDAGGPEVWTFDELLRECGKRTGKTNLRLLHIPIPVAMLLAKLFRILPRAPITVSNVLGSAAIVPMDPKPFFHDIGFTPRGMKEGLDLVFAKPKNVDPEAVALLRYVLPGASAGFPDAETVERFHRALSVHGITGHALDRRVVASPWLLGAIDAAAGIRNKTSILRRKLLVAAAIGECTPESAKSLLPQNRTPISVIIICISAGLRAAVKLFGGFILSFIAPSFYRRNAGC